MCMSTCIKGLITVLNTFMITEEKLTKETVRKDANIKNLPKKKKQP